MLLMPTARGMGVGTEPSKIKSKSQKLFSVSEDKQAGNVCQAKVKERCSKGGFREEKDFGVISVSIAEISFSSSSLVALGLKIPPLITHWIMPVAFLPDDSLATGWTSST